MSYDFLEDASEHISVLNLPYVILYCHGKDKSMYRLKLNIHDPDEKEKNNNKKAMIESLRDLANRLEEGYYDYKI